MVGIYLCLKRKGFCFSVQLMYFTSFGIQATKDWEQKLIYDRFELDTSCCFLFFNQLPLISLHLQRSQECSHDCGGSGRYGDELGWRECPPFLGVVCLV